MTPTAKDIWTGVCAVRDQAPVVHNITNYVVMNNTANALLALGASPVMAHAENEIRDMVNIASALVINIGTLSDAWIRSMFKAALHAQKRGIPLVFDPVGAGATPYRTQMAQELIDAVPPTIIRGNASEIMALVSDEIKTKGVDSLASSDQALVAAQALRQACGSVVCVSGETDYIVGDNVVRIMNGHPMMTRVTGLGCTATALCGAFAAVSSDSVMAAVQAMAVMGIAGELSVGKAAGPGTLQVHFLDALYNLTERDIDCLLKVDDRTH
ncbi:MAG: Hydroxyethylthiazole kinase [Syntrophus sp. SKADARSKE-3]|nr:Hydroxyethylthiazole kinase [Syntrophus sp. SKADARSKE-3]